MSRTAKVASQLKVWLSLKGSECIFKDQGHIKLVQVVGVNFSEEVITFELKTLETPGLRKRPPSSFKIGCNIDYLNCKEKYLHAPYVSWMLITDSKVVKHLVKFAEGLPQIDAFLKEMYSKLAERPIKPRKRTKVIPPK